MGINILNLGEINGSIPPPPPPIDASTEPRQAQAQTKPLLTDEDINNFINSQVADPQIQKQTPLTQPVPSTPPNHPGIQIPTQPTQEPINQQIGTQEEIKPTSVGDFDLFTMSKNLDDIVKDAKIKIKNLEGMQSKIEGRIKILEKFITIDEKNLAIEVSRQDQNTSKIIGLRKSISNQTELFGVTMEILLKFEAQIQGWYKTLMDIEKDKVSAYQKIKGLTKEAGKTDTDINDVLSSINTLIKGNPDKIFSGLGSDGTLNINGYAGKKFNG